MKKITVILMMALCQLAFSHAPQREVKKDDQMLKIEADVKKAITEENKYDKALEIYAEAARRNRSEPYYRQQYSILRRVIRMKNAMDSESDNKKWQDYYSAVHGYYMMQGYFTKALELAQQASEKLDTDVVKLDLMKLLIISGNDIQAEQIAGSNAGSLSNDIRFQSLQSLLLARSGQSAQAIEAAENLTSSTEPSVMVNIACIYMAVGQKDMALNGIAAAIENTAPTQVPQIRLLIKNMPEFKDMLEDEAFIKAVATESKVFQSGCTGGSSCGSCSLREKCPSSN